MEKIYTVLQTYRDNTQQITLGFLKQWREVVPVAMMITERDELELECSKNIEFHTDPTWRPSHTIPESERLPSCRLRSLHGHTDITVHHTETPVLLREGRNTACLSSKEK